jgi:hypothetical protein
MQPTIIVALGKASATGLGYEHLPYRAGEEFTGFAEAA